MTDRRAATRLLLATAAAALFPAVGADENRSPTPADARHPVFRAVEILRDRHAMQWQRCEFDVLRRDDVWRFADAVADDSYAALIFLATGDATPLDDVPGNFGVEARVISEPVST